jgi:hypothetical protein
MRYPRGAWVGYSSVSMPTFPFERRGAKFTGIPSVEAWQSLTTVTTLFYTHSRKNPRMLAIDAALAAFHKSDSVPFDPASEGDAAIATRKTILALLLMDVARACALWLTSKETTSSSNRRPAVTNLQVEAMVAVSALGVSFDDVDPKVLAASLASKAARMRWASARAGLATVRGGGKGKMLHDEYWGEVNIGGANPGHLQGGILSQDFQESSERFVFDLVRRSGGTTKVKYVAEADRWRYQIVFHEGRLYRRAGADSEARGDAIDTHGTGWIFVMDKVGRCYTSFGESPDGMSFHHSTILSGEAVAFAGGIEVREGRLINIDNGSGHYRPELAHLIRALFLLRTRHGVDLREVQLVYFAGFVDGMPVIKGHASALAFLLSGGEG